MWPSSSPYKCQPQDHLIIDHNKGPSKDDLHHWSIYRQSLNAALTNNSSLHHHPQHNTLNARDLTLDQEIVDNILACKHYTPTSPDADHYLRYGLPRVKSLKMQSFNIKQSYSIDHLSKCSGLVRNFVEKFENQNVSSSFNGRNNENIENINLKLNVKNANMSLNDDLDCRSSSGQDVVKGNKSKQWKSNPNLKEVNMCSVTESCVSEQFKLMNKQSMSAFDVRAAPKGSLCEKEMAKSFEDQLKMFRKYQNESKSHVHSTTNNDSNDESMTKSSPGDELDFRKSSLNGYQTDSFGEQNSQSKYSNIKPPLVQHQSSDSEFVLSLTESKSQVSGKTTKQPHLIVNKLYHEFDATSTCSLLCGGLRQKIRVLDNVNFEAKAGDMVALIATNPLETSQILDVIMNQHSRRRSRTFTEIYLNGQLILVDRLCKLCAYVGPDTDNLCNQMSTRQTVLFYNLIQSASRVENFDSKKRIDAVLEELNLSDVKHTSVGNLNESEKIRLQIAIAMMSDAEILLLDQSIRQMDILEYIKQWTLMTGKIAILALQPPSHEQLSFFNKVSLISTGRTIYFGDRSKMNVYFDYANYPCPQFKSPADYYLDLITVDHLSMSAMSESNVRIETLVQLYQKCGKKRRKPSSTNRLHSSEQNRKQSSFIIDSLSLFIRAMIFCFPFNVINLAKRLLLAVSLSLVCGCIFFKMRLGREQENVWDRLGFYHTLLAIFSIPLYLHEIKSIHDEKRHLLGEMRLKVYSKKAYFLSYLIYTLPGSTLIFLGYILPASSLAIIIQRHDLLYYMLIMLCYLQVIRLLTIAVSWCFSTKIRSSVAFGVIYFVLVMISGQNLHSKNANIVSRLAQNLSIYTWTYESMINWELEFENSVHNNTSNSANSLQRMMMMNQRYLCSNNPLVERAAIVARAECGIQSRDHIIEFTSMNNYFMNLTQPFIVYLGYTSVLLFIFYLVLSIQTANNSHLLSIHLKESSSFKKRCCKPEYL